MDAAIAAMLCDGLFNAHSMGIGGGHFLTYYSKETGRADHLNARQGGKKQFTSKNLLALQ